MLITIGIINLFVWLTVSFYMFVIRRLPFYHPISFYLFYHFFGFVTRPFVSAAPDSNNVWNYIGFVPTTGDLVFSSLITNLALIGLSIGSMLAPRGLDSETPILKRTFHVERKTLLLLTCLVIGVISFIATRHNNMGLSTSELTNIEYETDESGGQRLIGTSGYQTALENGFIALIFLVFLLLDVHPVSLCLFAPWILWRMWVGTGRWNFLLPLIVIGALTTWSRHKKWPSLAFVVLALSLFGVFNVLGGNREAFRNYLSGEYTLNDVLEEHQDRRGGEFGLSDFQEFEIATFICSVVPDSTGWNYGTQYLRLFVWPIPRQLWPDKPVFTSRIDLSQQGNVFGLSFSMPADFYSIIGIPSLLLGMGLVGFFLQWFYTKAVSTKSIYLFIAYWVLLMECPQWFRDGGVTVVYFFVFIFAPIALCVFMGNISMRVKTNPLIQRLP
jgi:hypothetical protein